MCTNKIKSKIKSKIKGKLHGEYPLDIKYEPPLARVLSLASGGLFEVEEKCRLGLLFYSEMAKGCACFPTSNAKIPDFGGACGHTTDKLIVDVNVGTFCLMGVNG